MKTAKPDLRPSAIEFLLSVGLLVVAVLIAVVAGAAWVLDEELVQSWALQRAGDDHFAQFEAVGRAGVWYRLWCAFGPVVIVAELAGWWWWPTFSTGIVAGWQGLRQATTLRGGRWRTAALRIALLVWSVTAVAHLAHAIDQRVTDSAYFGWRPGTSVLPNMSASNVEVIRYVEQATPPGSKILVLSDQKLFFLSYYLLPRKLYHRLHPDSEHVIAKEHQQRALACYRWEDLDPEWVAQLQPDYVLEYYEHPANVSPSRRADDRQWLRFVRALHQDAAYIPDCEVRLRPLAEMPR